MRLITEEQDLESNDLQLWQMILQFLDCASQLYINWHKKMTSESRQTTSIGYPSTETTDDLRRALDPYKEFRNK